MRMYLSTRGFTLIDKEDFDYFSKWKWCKHKCGYVTRGGSKNGKRIFYRLHREILGKHGINYEGKQTDHINGDTLDNRKINLRPCSQSENQRNRKLNSNSSTGFKGVSWVPSMNRFRARIHLDERRLYLGLFKDKEKAALAYNKAAKKYFGEFARLN